MQITYSAYRENEAPPKVDAQSRPDSGDPDQGRTVMDPGGIDFQERGIGCSLGKAIMTGLLRVA